MVLITHCFDGVNIELECHIRLSCGFEIELGLELKSVEASTRNRIRQTIDLAHTS
jgi:hypothetical protein